METSASHVRLARRLAAAAVGLAVLLVACAVLWLSRLDGAPESSHRGGPPEPPVPPIAGPQGPPVLPALGAEPLPALRGVAAPPSLEPGARSAPYPAGGDLDYLGPDSLPRPAARSTEAGDLDT